MNFTDEVVDFKDNVRFRGEITGFSPGEHIQKVLVKTITGLTDLNAAAGTSILPARTGYRYRILDIAVCSRGTMTTCTAVQFITSATAATIASFAVAQLVDNVVLRFGITGATPSVTQASGLPLPVNEGLLCHVDNHNAAITTSFDIIVSFVVEDMLK